ncbi:MAG: SDR family oxidoreductase [Thermoanaerobaculia bacterium]
MNLKEAKVLVTGGSSGIGLETARQLVNCGARVAICGRRATRVDEAAQSIGAIGIHGDVSIEDDVARIVKRVISEFGDYNVLVNNAGYGEFASLVETELPDMQRMFATNVFGAMLVARDSARHFIERKGGNIINVSSTAGQRGFAGGTAYVASKFALSGMTQCWRTELRHHNIRVMQINPSEVQTDFFSVAGEARTLSERKLRPVDIAHTIIGMLEMEDRGFVTDTTVWATNPD